MNKKTGNLTKDLASIKLELQRVVSATAEIAKEMEDLRESIIRTKQRTISGKELQQSTWKIWGHCRINKESLESEVHCKIIYGILESAVSDVQKRIEETSTDLEAIKRENRELKRSLKAKEKAEREAKEEAEREAEREAEDDFHLQTVGKETA